MSQKMIFGECTRVTKAVVRGVAKLEIEIPIEHYVAAVVAVDGRPVLVSLPVDEVPGGYGVYEVPA